MKHKDIIDAYVRIRTIDHTIPDDVLDFMKDSAISCLVQEPKVEEQELNFKLTGRDWTEDFYHENGKYCNVCYKCDQKFFGHKRRVICKPCQEGKPEEQLKEKQEYSRQEVEKLLLDQMEYTAHSLRYSSAVYVYPADHQKIYDWQMKAGLIKF